MKILITVDPEIPVPPINYGGVERLVDSLIFAFTQEGHDVILVANKNSTAKANRIYGWCVSSSVGKIAIIKNTFQLLQIVRSEKPDIIHSFSRLLYLYPIFLFKNLPVLMTYGRYISNKSTSIANILGGKKLQFTCCGAHMLSHIGKHKVKFTPVHNFTSTDYFVPNDSIEKEYLMFLGRIEDIKGTKEAIEATLATNEKLIIAGNIQPGHDEYFKKEIEPFIDNVQIKYVGPVNDEQKRYYLQRSKAFLFPIKWEEPFGIVMAEAMACGVPVIGFRRGSVPEVVQDGVTGFIVDDTHAMTDAIRNIGKIDRNKVRLICENRFSLKFISQQYLSLLSDMVNRKKNSK